MGIAAGFFSFLSQLKSVRRSGIHSGLMGSLAFASLLAIGSPTITNAQTASLRDLGQVSGAPALATAVSADGKVVTGYLFGNQNQAFRWANGTITPLGFLGATNSKGMAINADGSVITGDNFSSGPHLAFRWSGGTMSAIGALPVTSPPCGANTPQDSRALAINAAGSIIVGISVDNSECNGNAFRWTSGSGTQAITCPLAPSLCFQNYANGVSADGSVVYGFASQSGDLSGAAWRWTGGTPAIFAGPCGPNSSGASAFPSGATPDGSIAIGSIANCAPGSDRQAFTYSPGSGITRLGHLPGGNDSRATAVNANGSVVVGYENSFNGIAFRWTAATGMQSINSLLTAAGVDTTGWGLNQATGVSADGSVIVGVGTGPCNCAAGWMVVLPTASPLLAAVLPASRSAQPGGTVTAFATIINSGTTAASACSISPVNGLPATFVYQTTDPATNALIGSANTPVAIPAGKSQSFVIALSPTAPIPPTNVAFNFACNGVPPAPTVIGLNTLLVSASASATPDVIALGATLKNDGVVHVTGSPLQGVFAVATDNLGASDTITVATNTGSATLPVTVTVCQTNPQSGQCLQTPGATVTTPIGTNTTSTFAFFVNATNAVAFDPANNRIFVTFTDSTSTIRGATSVAVTTQ